MVRSKILGEQHPKGCILGELSDKHELFREKFRHHHFGVTIPNPVEFGHEICPKMYKIQETNMSAENWCLEDVIFLLYYKMVPFQRDIR